MKCKAKKNVAADCPLRCEIRNNQLIIRLGLNTLAFAAENPFGDSLFADGSTVDDGSTITVVDKRAWAEEVLRALENEDEQGTAPVHTLLDQAMRSAIDDGAVGVEVHMKRPEQEHAV